MAITVEKQLVVIDGIQVDNRLHSEVTCRVEMRGRMMVLILESKHGNNGILLPSGMPVAIRGEIE